MWFWKPSHRELELDDAVRGVAKVATELTAIPLEFGDASSITTTKFGGVPYAEEGEEWPTFLGRPYDFVAQLNLKESFAPPTDAYDLITVFISWIAIEGHADFSRQEADEAFEKVCVVRTYRNPSEARAVAMTRPEPAHPDDYRVVACAAEVERVLSFPSPYGKQFRQIPLLTELSSKHRSISEKLRGIYSEGLLRTLNFNLSELFSTPSELAQASYLACLKRIGYDWREENSQIGGYSVCVQSDEMELEDDLFFLAQIAYEPTANFCIGDAAPLLIAAHYSDPTRFECDPWQTH